MKLYKNVHVVLTFGSSGFGRISKSTCDVSLVFASSSNMNCKFVPSNLPQGFSYLILNFPCTRHTKEPL